MIQKTFRAYEGRKIYRQRLKVLHFLVSANNHRVYTRMIKVSIHDCLSLFHTYVGAFGGNEKKLLLHYGREGTLEQAQYIVLCISFPPSLPLYTLPSFLLSVASLPPTLHSISDLIWLCVHRSKVHGGATTFGSIYLTTMPRRDTWKACSKRTALSGT